MKAMILSAGFGTRLKPLTNDTPKALIKYKGSPMINHQIERLKNANITEITVNAHHLHEKISDYFFKNDFGVKINVIIEKDILGTGGGILNAEKYFYNEDSFLVINADIDTDINLAELIRHHSLTDSFATLAVQKRKSKKYLEFDKGMLLKGRENNSSSPDDLYAFNGIHVISKRIFLKRYEVKFSNILDLYFDAISSGGREFVTGYDSGTSVFKDLGKKENLQ